MSSNNTLSDKEQATRVQEEAVLDEKRKHARDWLRIIVDEARLGVSAGNDYEFCLSSYISSQADYTLEILKVRTRRGES